MITISLCMIVKNEEDTLAHCLESVKNFVDEINIIDTGSTDQTKKIAAKYTDRIFDFEWVDDFGEARNYAFQQATMDYILWMDADDVFLEPDQKKAVKLKETLDKTVDSVTMDYYLAFDEYGNVTSQLKRNRLVKRLNHFQWIGAVHEYLHVWGNIINSDIAISHMSKRHETDRNLIIYEKQLSEGKELSIRDLYYFANELNDHGMYERAIQYYEQFLATKEGWIEDNISACSKLADCYYRTGNHEKEREAIYRSFQFDRPRPEFCCRLGFKFLQEKQYKIAAFWYNLATQTDIPDNWGFVNTAFSTWLPHLQLCLCYDGLGEYDLAQHHNELALHIRPNDSRMLHNKKYLKSKLEKRDLT